MLILADLHLPPHPTDSDLSTAFARFCLGPARAARAVYILGDLFDAWLGDATSLPQHAPEIDLLRGLAQRGVEVFVQHGNRDFLLGPAFERASGARLLPDQHPVWLGGVPTLLAHGDQWCLGDTAYQRWRRVSRAPVLRRLAEALPSPVLRRVARLLRQDSRRRGRRGAATEGGRARQDVTPLAVDAAARQAGAARVIHGHTHRPATHRHGDGGENRLERVVLPDWRPGHYGWLRVDGDGLRSEFLPPAAGAPA